MTGEQISLVNKPYLLSVDGLVDQRVHLKLECFNIVGSIKLKTAEGLLDALERNEGLKAGNTVIESSSGNLGVALASLCARRGYKFLCVVDSNASQQNIRVMKAFGADVHVDDQVDENGGYLESRVRFVKEYISTNTAYWTNQYANPDNPLVQSVTTAREVHDNFSDVDCLVVGAGTAGALTDCIRYFCSQKSDTITLAVGSAGSLTFRDNSLFTHRADAPKRYIPGLGTSRIPEIFDRSSVLEYTIVSERDTVEMCRFIARTHGYLPGGSTGTVLAGLRSRPDLVERSKVIVAISPDGGEGYLDTVYDDHWASEHSLL